MPDWRIRWLEKKSKPHVQTPMSAPYVLWTKQTAVMNTIGEQQYPSIVSDSNGNIYIAYQTSGTISGGTNSGTYDIVVLKMNTNGTIVWIKQTAVMNTTLHDYNPSIGIDSSNNVYVSYYSLRAVSGGTNIGGYDIVVFKLDTNGNMVWVKETAVMNTTGHDLSPSLVVDISGNVYVAYRSNATASSGTFLGSEDIVMFKLNTNGNMVWLKQYALMNTGGWEGYQSVTIDTSGNLYLTYCTEMTISGGTRMGGTYDIVVSKVDTNGNVVWIKQLAVMNTNTDEVYPKIAIDSSGNLYVTYQTAGAISGGTFRGVTDIVVAKLNNNGSVIWTKETAVMNTTLSDTVPSIAVDSSSNVYVTYQSSGTVSGGARVGGSDIVLFKLDTNGNMIWIKEDPIINTVYNEINPVIALDSSKNIFISYTTNLGTVSGGTRTGTYDLIVAKYFQPGLPTVPDAPTGVSAVAGNTQATVSFTAPANNGGATITSYTVTSSPGGVTATGAASPITVTGLTKNTSYTFTVTATNSEGTGAASSASVAVTPYGPPDAPSAVSASPESLRALVSWTKPASNGGSAITSYTVTSNPGSFTATVNGADNTSCYVYGLSNGTAYTFTVTATNLAGTGSASDASTPVTPVADAPTTAVTTAVASNDTTSITNYVAGVSASTPAEYTALSIDMRTSLNAGTVGATTQQKVDTKLAYIDSMRTKVGADNFTVPQADFTAFLQTFNTVANQTFTPKPIVAYVPAYTDASATIDVSTASAASYVMVEVPIGYTAVLQNGAASISLTYNGTNYSDGTNTYNAGAVIVLGTKTLTLIGIGSGGFDFQDNSNVICVAKGSMVRTPAGEVPVETLRMGDVIKTGDGRKAPITNMQQIVVVAATTTNAPYIIEAGAFGPGLPPNRMEVSPRHAIQLRPGLWEIPREAATENKLVYQNKATLGKQVIYYHFSLPNYATDTAIVNGQITEVLNDGRYKESYLWNASKGGYERTVKAITSNTISK